MNKKQIILIGGGGHCKSCIDVIESTNEFSIAGIVDTKDKIGTSYNTFISFPHKHFSFARAETHFKGDVYVKDFIRITKETYEINQ